MVEKTQKADISVEDNLIAKLTKSYEDNNTTASASYLWQSSTHVKEWISTGSKLLDVALSNRKDGGIPVGRLTEISGAEHAGKTLLASYILANTQKKGGVAILIDTESAASMDVLKATGVDVEKLVYVNVASIEDVFRSMQTITDHIQSSNEKKLITIVWDSVAGTSNLAEIEGDYGDKTVALSARLIAQGLRKFIPICSNYRICLVFINQLKTKIGVTFGDNLIPPGGRSIPYHASIILRVSNFSSLKDGDSLVGRVIKCEVKKNKVAPPMRTVYYSIRWGGKLGAWLDESEQVLDVCVDNGILAKISAQKYSFTGKSGKLQDFTKKTFYKLLKSDNSFSDEIFDALYDKLILTEENISQELSDEVQTEDSTGE